MQPRFVKLSGFYFFYFAILGAYTPYWPLYLQDLGFSVREIGELMAITLATKVVAPYIWGWIADHSAQRLKMIQISAFFAALSFLIIFLSDSYWFIALTVFLFSFFWNALLPQFEVVTLDSLRHQSHHYSRIRLWGSIGFIVAVLSTSLLVNLFGSTVVPWVLATILILLWVSGMCLTPIQNLRKHITDSPHQSWDSTVIVLLAVSCLLQLSHGPYYAYFTIYMESYGYSTNLIGGLWAFGVVCEIAVLLYVSKLLKRFSIPSILIAVAIITAMRWLLIGNFPTDLYMIIFAQALHAITFGVYHAAMMHALSLRLPAALKGRGQALYASVSFGVGGGLGTYLASVFWEDIGATMVFTLAAAVSLSAIALLVLLYKPAPPPPSSSPLNHGTTAAELAQES